MRAVGSAKPQEVIRATKDETEHQIQVVENMHKGYAKEVSKQLLLLQEKSLANENIFEQLMEASKVCTIGQITEILFQVGGQYRRNM